MLAPHKLFKFVLILAILPSVLSACEEPFACFPALDQQESLGACGYQQALFACYSKECCSDDSWNSVLDRLDATKRGFEGDKIDCAVVCGDGSITLTYPWDTRIKMSIELTATQFNAEEEKIKDAIAEAADVSSSRVRIRGALLKPPASAEVDVGVDALDKDDADLLAGRLTEAAINAIMKERELTQVTVIEAGFSADKKSIDNQGSGASNVVIPIFAAVVLAMASSLRVVC